MFEKIKYFVKAKTDNSHDYNEKEKKKKRKYERDRYINLMKKIKFYLVYEIDI